MMSRSRWRNSISTLALLCLLIGALVAPVGATKDYDAHRFSGLATDPWWVCVDPGDNSCWVADFGGNSVLHLDENGNPLAVPDPPGPSYASPYGLAVDPNDHSCWVADHLNNRVVHIFTDGTPPVAHGGVSRPTSVAVNPNDGSCWVASHASDEVVHIAADGTELYRVQEFSQPHAVAVDESDDSCVVTDLGNHRVVRITPGDPDYTTQELNDIAWTDPYFVAVDSDPARGWCWISDYAEDKVVRLDPDAGSDLTIPGLNRPHGVSVDATDGSCWVADRSNNRVVHLGEDGTELWSNPPHIPFSGPTSVSVNHSDGSCWVADRWNGDVVHLVPAPRYGFLGFLPPMADESKRVFKRKSTIPVKFRITDRDGNPVSDAVATLAIYYVGQGAPPDEPEVVSTAAGDWGDQFRYDANDDLYIFNLSTKGEDWIGWFTYEAVVTLDDGQEFSQPFSLK